MPTEMNGYSVKVLRVDLSTRQATVDVINEETLRRTNLLQDRLRMVEDADFILAGWGWVETEVIERGRNLKLIQKTGIGYDKIDTARAEELGIPVAIAAGSNALPVAEHALLLMLAVYRKLPYVDRSLRQGVWQKNQMRAETRFLTGKTVGLLGFGHVAKRLCRLLQGFECEILYYDLVRPAPEEEARLGARYCPSMEDVLAASDVVSLHLPLNAATRDLVNEENIHLFKQGAILINTSRGGVVSEAALYRALVDGPLAGAGIDVFGAEPTTADHPLFALDNVVVTPHMAGAVLDNVAIVGRHCFDNMLRVVEGRPLPAADVVVQANVAVEAQR